MTQAVELRRHPRFPCPHMSQVSADAMDWRDCVIKDMSGGGACLESNMDVNVGDNVILYVDQVAHIDATVVRQVTDGFAVAFNLNSLRDH